VQLSLPECVEVIRHCAVVLTRVCWSDPSVYRLPYQSMLKWSVYVYCCILYLFYFYISVFLSLCRYDIINIIFVSTLHAITNKRFVLQKKW